MLKLFKLLKPYTLLIIVCILLVAVVAIASLLLPDRMSVIIGEGITTEYEFETTADGHTIYIIFGNLKTELPKFVYEGAGELVLTYNEATDT